LDNITPDPPLQADRVSINYPVDLRLVAECVDTSVDTLQELNPGLLRMTTPKEGDFDLGLPAGTRDKYLAAIAAIPTDMRVWWRYYKVAEGDTLASVAKRYHTTPKAISAVNNLQSEDLDHDAKLIIPIAAGKEAEHVTYSRAVVRYKVRGGDTVLSVADEWGVPAEMVRKWNHLRGNTLQRGRVLSIHRPADELAHVSGQTVKAHRKASNSKSINNLRASSRDARRTLHTVKQGETLFSIANRYNTSVAALRRDNTKLGVRLHPGDVVVVTTNR